MTKADFIDVGTSFDLSEALMMSVIVGSSSFLDLDYPNALKCK